MSYFNFGKAKDDFDQARRRASIEKIVSRFTGKSTDLLSFDEVRDKLRGHNTVDRGLQNIRLDKIVGSVGRYKDFTRTFAPLTKGDKERWANVKVYQVNEGMPPIKVYQIDEVYFVADGNHRVSIAREMELTKIEAFVTEVKTAVSVTTDDTIDDIIRKAEYNDFLAQTKLSDLRPDSNLIVTEPGKFPLLLEHIDVHRYFMGVEEDGPIDYETAVIHWYDNVYLPVVEVIREQGLLAGYPHRTEADLYIWLAEHRAEVEASLGWSVRPAAAAADLAQRFGDYNPAFSVTKVLRGVDEAAPPPRWEMLSNVEGDSQNLFTTILVPIGKYDTDWHGLMQAIMIAQKEDGMIKGLFAVSNEAVAKSLAVQSLQKQFKRKCKKAGIKGELLVEVGNLTELAFELARWADLVVWLMPAERYAQKARLSKRLRKFLRNAPAPVLIVPSEPSELAKPLLAYDGEKKTDSALFVATYVGKRWKRPLDIVSVADVAYDAKTISEKAQKFTDQHKVKTTLFNEKGQINLVIRRIIHDQKTDLLIMGGLNFQDGFLFVGDSTVVQMLRETQIPILISR